MLSPSPPVLKTLRLLGYGGLIPFFALALLSLNMEAPQVQSVARQALLAYTVSILSFVGAVSWGIALAHPGLSDSQRHRLLVYSVVPSLLAWLAALLPDGAMRWVVFADLTIVLFVADRIFGRAMGWPADWLRLRLHLTLGVTAALLLAATGYGG
ncbi:MAG: hypothetical protein RLY30_262 [Pseudomonadota bacterium]|jgi:hypothetical protein